MLDLHYRSYIRSYLCNRWVWSELTIGCQSSCCDFVRGSTLCHTGLVRAHFQLPEFACIVAVILSEASQAIALVLSEPTVSCQSPHVYSPWSCWRFPMLSPWSCWSPLSVVWVRTWRPHELVRGFQHNRPGFIRAHCQISESACILAVNFVRIEVDYQNQDMCFTDCHSDGEFRTLYVWNEFSLFSINCIPIIHRQTNLYYLHE